MKEKKHTVLYWLLVPSMMLILANHYEIYRLNKRIDEIELDLEKIDEHINPFYDQS